MYTALPGLLPTLSQVELYIQNMVGGSGMVAPPQPCQPHRETSDTSLVTSAPGPQCPMPKVTHKNRLNRAQNHKNT